MTHAKPTELKRALGNPGKRKLPDQGKVIMLPQISSEPPTQLSKAEKTKWIELRRSAPWIAVTDEPLLTSLVQKMTRQKEIAKDDGRKRQKLGKHAAQHGIQQFRQKGSFVKEIMTGNNPSKQQCLNKNHR